MSKNNDVKNFYEIIPKDMLDNNPNPNYGKTHKFKTPHRSLIIGASGGGKTNWVCNYLERMCSGKGTFATILYLCKDKTEPLLKFLTHLSDQIQVKEGLSHLPKLEDIDKSVNHLIIIDDLVLTKDQSRIETYYMMCRKKNVSIMYISQSYYRTPKFIRINANELILLKVSGEKDLRMILSEGAMGLDKDQLTAMYNDITKEKFCSLIVDMNASPEERYVKNFMEVIDVSKYSKKKKGDEEKEIKDKN
jgi:hypothetical protein